jgi:hypothetical protein
MNLLRDSSLLRLWRRLAVRGRAAPMAYTVTVPAPLAAEVVELRRAPAPSQVLSSPLPRVVNG